jgi:hypothetical protein
MLRRRTWTEAIKHFFDENKFRVMRRDIPLAGFITGLFLPALQPRRGPDHPEDTPEEHDLRTAIRKTLNGEKM